MKADKTLWINLNNQFSPPDFFSPWQAVGEERRIDSLTPACGANSGLYFAANSAIFNPKYLQNS